MNDQQFQKLAQAGVKNSVGQPIFAKFGAIDGSVAMTAEGTQTVPDGGIPWAIPAPLTNQMQARVGSERKIIQASADLVITGEIPADFSSNEVLKNYIKQQSKISITIGGVPQAIYSFEQMEDTKFIQRALNIILVPDPSLFSSLAFNLLNNSTGQFFPMNPIGTYFITLNVITYWDYPPPNRQYPQKRQIGATR